MIGKASGGSDAGGILDYCYYEKKRLKDRKILTIDDVRGEVFYIQNLGLNTLEDGRIDVDYFARQFEQVAALNKSLKNYIWHQSFSFQHGEDPSNEILEELTKEFSKSFGFENNQMVAFKHTDKKHNHIHIVANRIDSKGKTSAKDSYSHLRIGNFCRAMETKFNLKPTPNMKALDKRPEKQLDNSIANHIRNRIDFHLKLAKEMAELYQRLKEEKIKLHVGRGLALTDITSGISFKGSDLGRDYSLKSIEERLKIGDRVHNIKLELNLNTKEEFDTSSKKVQDKETTNSSNHAIFIKSKIDEYLLLVNSIEELKEALQKEKIVTEIGRGISFKYQNERFKGSDLGREYSLMNLSKRLALNPSRINEVENDVKSESISKDKPEDKKQEAKPSSTSYNFVEQGSAGRRPNFKDEEKEEEKNRKKAFKFKR